jgi:hypothetical protein
VSHRTRGPWREVLAVCTGAGLGSIVVSLLALALTGFTTPFVFIIVPVIGIPSAIGFAIWVLVAWWPHLRDLPVR